MRFMDWDFNNTGSTRPDQLPSARDIFQSVRSCNYQDVDQINHLSELLNRTYQPLILLGQHNGLTLKLTPTTSELIPRLNGVADDPRKVLPESVLGINLRAYQNGYEPQGWQDGLLYNPKAAPTAPLGRSRRYSSSGHDSTYGSGEAPNEKFEPADVDYLSIFYQVGKVYMFCGDFSTHVQGQLDNRWTDTGYVLVIDVTNKLAGSVWLVKNFYRWDDNTCERVHLTEGTWTGFSSMTERASIIHVRNLFTVDYFHESTNLHFSPAWYSEAELVLIRQEDNEFKKETVWKPRQQERPGGNGR